MDDDFIYSIIKQMALTFKVPLNLLTHNTKYQDYEKENEN